MIKKFSYIFFPIILVLSCEDVAPTQDNPLDPGNEDYVEPTITFVGDISNGDTIYSESITLGWDGNELVTEYRYKLDEFPWAEWSNENFATLDYLDEGQHNISIQSRYLSGDTSAIIDLDFIVDAVDGPSLMFFPRRHITTQGETVIFKILAEEVSALMAAEIHIDFDPSKIEIISISQGNFFQNGQESIFSYDINDGSIEILTSLLNSEIPYVNGTGELAQIEVKTISDGLITLSFNPYNNFRNPQNENINISNAVNGLVEVY